MICKKGYVGSLVFLLLISWVYYIIRIYTTTRQDECVYLNSYLPLASCHCSGCLLFKLPATCTLDKNTPFAQHNGMVEKLPDQKFKFYHLLVGPCHVFYRDNLQSIASIMLDVAHEVAPLIQNTLPDESEKYRGVMVTVIGFRLAFHVRILTFFWQKLFHGEKDLFAEPNEKLVEESLVEKKQADALEKTVTLEEIVCT